MHPQDHDDNDGPAGADNEAQAPDEAHGSRSDALREPELYTVESVGGEPGTTSNDGADEGVIGDEDADGTVGVVDEPDDERTAEPIAAPIDADTRPRDRAEQAGYPPDHGEEQPVMRVRPAFFLPNVLGVLGLTIGPALIAFIAWWITPVEYRSTATRWTGIVLGGVGVTYLVAWWLVARHSYMLEITNKRTIEHIGLFSKTTDEVLHDHVRNVTIEQSFYDRLVNIGRIGIASAGQAGTEIEMKNVPRPRKVREVIDLYRPVG